MNISRLGAAGLAAGLAIGLSPLAAVADDILPPDGVAPVVGMAYDGDGLWLAGASANDGVVVKAGFEFDVPVRFDTDMLDVTLDFERLGSITSIPLIEVRK